MPAIIQFLHPEFLYGLFALAIPVLLHLFSFKKYKKVYFSNFSFLQSLQQQKKNSSRLKNLLLLFLRLTVLAALVVAFAFPYITPKHSVTTSEKPQVIIYADNSFSMSNTGTHGTLLEEAKKHLFDIVNTYPSGTTFILLTNDRNNLPALSREELISTLAGLKVSPSAKKLSEIFKIARDAGKNKKSTLFLLSDFQKENCDFQQIPSDTLTEPVFLMLEPENTNNLYIKDVSFEQVFHQKHQNDKISIQIANSSDKDFNNVPVSLYINDKKKSVHKVNVPAQGEQTLEIHYLNTEEGHYKGRVEISDYPVVFDNRFYFTYHIDHKINILCLEQNEHLPFFGKLFADSTAFHFDYLHINRTANLDLSRYNLIILDRLRQTGSGLESALETYLNDGGNLFILPGEQLSVNVLNNLLQKLHASQFGRTDTNTVITRAERESALFKDAFEKPEENSSYPYVRNFYHFLLQGTAEKLLNDKQNNPLLLAQPVGKGTLYLAAFNFGPENSDMVYHPLFVPLLVNMAYNLHPALNTSWFLNSGTPVILNKELPEGETKLLIRHEANTIEFIPEIRKDFSGNPVLMNTQNLQEAGIYYVQKNGVIADMLACNYDRTESQMQFCDKEELQKHFPQARVENIKSTRLDRNSELVKEIVLQDNHKYLAVWFVLLAILVLLGEQYIWRKKLR